MNNLLNILKTAQTKILVSRATQVLLFVIIFLIPFSVRHVFHSAWNFQTGAYSDFTSLSIYLSDIILILLITAVWIIDIHFHLSTSNPPKSGQLVSKLWKWSGILLIAWLLIELAFSTSLPLQLFFTSRLILLVIFALTIVKINVPREKIAWLFAILGFIQSCIAIIQFHFQTSIGLYKLGESHLSPTMFGIAKIVSQSGETLIRGYGTFPHSNLLSAFLVTATLFNLYLLNKPLQDFHRKYHVVTLYIMLAVNIFGLFITFSRGGIIAFGAALLGLLIVFLLNKQFSNIIRLIVPCGTIIVLSIMALSPYLSSRATITDASTKDRIFYDQVGQSMIKENPIFGLGAGTSVLHMKQFMEKLNPGEVVQTWDIQPIHNFFLISWAELGIGAIFLLFLILYPIFLLFKRVIKNPTTWELTLAAILGSYLVLFLIDHYFYTIWPTQLLLWLMVGLALKACSTWNNQASSQK